MQDNVKGLLAKVWKDEVIDLEPGKHFVDETVVLRIVGPVEKHVDQLVSPTTSIPLITTLALFVEKSGMMREHAIKLLREALLEAMQNGKDKDERIQARLKDVETAVETVKSELIAKLPKQRRAGRLVTKDLEVEVCSVADTVLSVA